MPRCKQRNALYGAIGEANNTLVRVSSSLTHMIWELNRNRDFALIFKSVRTRIKTNKEPIYMLGIINYKYRKYHNKEK